MVKLLFARLGILLAIMLLAGCGITASSQGGDGQAGAIPGGNPTSLPGVATQSGLAQPPAPDALTTAELNTRLDPFTAPLCALPCYGGLTPGQDGLQESLNFLGRLGISALDLIPGDYQAAQDGTGKLGATLLRSTDILNAMDQGFVPPDVEIGLESNLVRYAYVRWTGAPAYLTFARVIEQMGQPEKLDLALIFKNNQIEFVVQMIYTSQQTGFAFLGQAASDGTTVQVCTSGAMTATLMGVFAPDKTPMAGLSHQPYLLSVDQGVGISGADFAGQMSSTGCVSIASDRWAAWQALQP
jgi:hypothetical protein